MPVVGANVEISDWSIFFCYIKQMKQRWRLRQCQVAKVLLLKVLFPFAFQSFWTKPRIPSSCLQKAHKHHTNSNQKESPIFQNTCSNKWWIHWLDLETINQSHLPWLSRNVPFVIQSLSSPWKNVWVARKCSTVERNVRKNTGLITSPIAVKLDFKGALSRWFRLFLIMTGWKTRLDTWCISKEFHRKTKITQQTNFTRKS